MAGTVGIPIGSRGGSEVVPAQFPQQEPMELEEVQRWFQRRFWPGGTRTTSGTINQLGRPMNCDRPSVVFVRNPRSTHTSIEPMIRCLFPPIWR